MEFLRQNASVISALAAVGSFFIWTIYAFLFYSEFRRRRSSHIFIHAAGNGGPETECLVINLSSEPIHIFCSLVASDQAAVQIQANDDKNLSLKGRSKQGPLGAGESLSLGRFDQIVQKVKPWSNHTNSSDTSTNEFKIEVRVVAIHGMSDEPAGAARAFIYNSATSNVIPCTAHTEQKRSRCSSKEVRTWMAECNSYRKAQDDGK